MKPALAQVSTLHSSFEDDIADYAAGQCQAIELWLGKLETYLESHAVEDVRSLLAEHRIAAPVASFQGGLLASQGEARAEHWSHFRRRLELCRALGVETLIVAADVPGPLSRQDFDRVCHSLAEAAQAAATANVRLALEFQARSALINNLETATALVAQTGASHLGVCLDLFHYYTGPSKSEDLRHLSAANLFHVQVCDLAGTARELASDADRILPGEGDFLLEPLLEYLGSIDYDGYVSIELLNPQVWQVPALQFGEIAMTALRKLLGQADMHATANSE
ncbi:MAG: sugar phosphate isomerase/epimerase [Planctomycetales bacterium]|nr:sugar phosphate isomerase/epimerase [Planctomycetales bacterium]